MAYSVADFAKKIRTKYPQYKGIGDLELTKSVVEKYPEYKDQVSIPGDGLMFSPEAVEGFNNSPIVKKVKGLFNQGSQIAKQTQQQIKAPAPTAEEAGIRRAPNQVKDSISSFFKGSNNRDVQIFGNLAGDVGSAAQMGLNFVGGGVFDTLTGLGNIRKQIESEGYMKTGKNIASGVGEMARQGFEIGKQAIFGNEEESQAAQNKIVEFIQKYPDAVIFGGKGIMDLAKGAKNTAGFAKTMYDNPSFNVIDDAGNVAGKTTARQVVADNFRTAAKTLFGKKTPQQPTAGPGGKQAQGRRWRPNEEPGQPTAGQGPIRPMMPDDGGAGTTFDGPNVATPFQDFDNTFRGGVTSTMNKIGGKIGKGIDKITTPVAEIITKNKTGSQKIYSAVAPRYNKLSGKNTQSIAKMKKQIETISAVAIQLNMRPKGLGDFIDTTDEIIKIMGEKVQEKLGSPLQVDMDYIASKIDEYVDEKSKAGIVTDAPGLNKLREQADAFRQMGVIDMPQANKIKQELNTRAGWDDPDLSQVTKNGYTTASVALGDALSTLLSDLPGEFRYYKETMGAGLAIMDDLMKSLTQEMKKSTNGIVESFSRISGLGDVLGGLISLSPSRTFSGLGTFIIGESHGKLKNKDFLIDRGFEQLYKELGKPEPAAPYIPKKSDFSGKGEAGITDQQIMKDFAGGKRYNEFASAKQADIDAKTKQEAELKAQQERMVKRAKEQDDMKKEKIETQKRRFDAAIKSGLYEEIQPMKTPLREGDLTEFYGEVTRRFTDRGMQKVDAEDGTNMGVYEVGKVARPKGGEPKAPANTPDEGAPEGEGGPIATDDVTDGTIKTKGFKQDQYKKAADDMLGTSIESLSPEGQKLFQKAIQATSTKNRLALIDELLFNYGTTDAKTAYLMEIGETGNQADIQDAINSLEKYGFGKENQYTPEEYEFTLSYMRDLLTTKDMEQPSLFSSITDEPKTTGGTPQRQIQDTTEIRVDQTKPNSDIAPSNGKNEPGGNGSVSVGGGSSNGGGLVGTIKRQSNKSVIGRFTNSLLSVIESNGGMQDGYLKVESGSDAMMPFVIEEIGRNQIAVSHFYIQEGDVMYDPEVIFNVNQDGSLDAVSIMNSGMGGIALPIKNSDSFLDTRARNIEMYIKAPTKPVKSEKFIGKTKVGDSTQTATIKDGKITVTNRDGRNIVLEYDIPISEWENALKPGFGDNSFNIESNITKLLKEQNADRWREAENNPEYSSFYSRIADGQKTAIKEAYKSYKDSMDPMKQLEPEFDKFIGSLEKVKDRDYMKEIEEVVGNYGKLTRGDDNKPNTYRIIQNELEKIEGMKEFILGQGIKNKDEFDYFISRVNNRIRPAINKEKAKVTDEVKKQIFNENMEKSLQKAGVIKEGEKPLTGILSPENKSLSKAKKDDIQKTAVDILEKKNYSMDVADYTAEEIQTFKTYSGVSGLTAEAGVLDQFYTPSAVIKSMWNLVGKYHDGPVQLALEPAAGIGRMALVGPEGIKYDMFEIDKTAGTIAQILNQDSKVTIGDFQDLFMDGRKPKNYSGKYYDIAISNPPYKARQTKQRGLGELQEFDRFEDYFTYRQLQMVKPGGVVVTIVPSAFLDKGSYKAKEMIASLGKLVDAYRLPEGTFPDTQIGTDILVFKKEPGNINDLIDKNFFKNNPDKILGEEKNATDRFGKPIIKVIGEKNAVTKIDGQTPKTIQNYSTTPTKPQTQQGLFAPATPNNAPIKKPDVNKPILAKKDEIFETQTITMGNQDPKILQYQKDVDVLGHLNGYTIDDIAKDPNGLNYMNGKIYSNYHYLQGNIREKLDDLQRDYTGGKIDKNIYDRQKSKLEAILPETISVMDVQFSPFDTKLINMSTGEQKRGATRDSEKRQTVETRENITVRDLFRDWLKDNKPRGITSSQYQISRILDGKVEKGDGPIKSKIQIDAQKAFNAFMKDGLPTRMQEDIAREYNYTYNSYVKPDNKSQPLVISDVSTTFKGGKFKFTDAQVEGINHLTNKGAGLIAYGVGVGKTITGLGATIAAMQKGWTKRPLFVVPKATLQHTWIGTIKELFPNYKVVNLGGLGVPDIKRLTKEYGANPADWIKDGEIAITTFQGLKNITLKPENESLLVQDLQDVMGTPSTGNAKKDQKKTEKLEMEAGKSLRTFGKSEIFLEDLGIDHLTIDEVHNMKNIFQSAEVRKEDGEINPFGAVLKGTSSDLGRKAYLASQYIMRKNNNRGVYALSATPFNNQPIEVYNLLALMAKKRLEDMGIKNINDFFTTFSYIQTEKVISPANFREIVERPVMKSFSNVGELQKLLTEFIDYKDSATAITMQQRPDKVVKRHIIKPSALQQTVNDRIRQRVDENQTKDGVYLVSMGQSIMNATSPYFVNSAYSHIPEPRNGAQIFRDSPKLQMALDMTKATLESGKGNVFWFMEQGVDYHPMIVDHIQETLGLKKGEVAFISGKITQDKKDAIAEGFRQGQVKVLVGGKTTSEGIDLQKHGVTTIFFSLNWNPTTTVQAGGRVWRPGNPRDKVYEAYLLSEDSGDLRLMQKYEEKASRINDIFSYQGRVFEDPSMTDGEAKMALLTDPFAKAEQQMNMDKIDIESKIDDYKYLIERNNGKFDILKNSTLKVEKLEESIQYYVDKEKYGKLPDYQIEQVDNFKKEIAREKRKVDDIIKKHDKDYSKLDREEAITNIMGDLTESNKNAMTETDILKKEAENIKEKLPEYEKYFVDEKMKIDSMKLTPEQQIEEYKKFLDSVKVI